MVIGPFWLIMKLMDGPLRFFDIYGWPPFDYEAYGWPLWSLEPLAISMRRGQEASGMSLLTCEVTFLAATFLSSIEAMEPL